VLNAAGLIEFCRVQLAAYKVPRDIVAVDELPTSMLARSSASRSARTTSPATPAEEAERPGSAYLHPTEHHIPD